MKTRTQTSRLRAPSSSLSRMVATSSTPPATTGKRGLLRPVQQLQWRKTFATPSYWHEHTRLAQVSVMCNLGCTCHRYYMMGVQHDRHGRGEDSVHKALMYLLQHGINRRSLFVSTKAGFMPGERYCTPHNVLNTSKAIAGGPERPCACQFDDDALHNFAQTPLGHAEDLTKDLVAKRSITPSDLHSGNCMHPACLRASLEQSLVTLNLEAVRHNVGGGSAAWQCTLFRLGFLQCRVSLPANLGALMAVTSGSRRPAGGSALPAQCC